MPTRDYDYVQQWLDGITSNYDPFVELEKIATKCGIEVDNKKQTITVKNPVSPFEIQSVLSNRKKNAFTVVWADGTHTTVHCQSGDEWDDEKALAMCFTKKALGNKGNFNDKFNDALDNKMKTIHTPESAKKVILSKEEGASSISFTHRITLNEEAVKKMTEAPTRPCECDGKRDSGIHSCINCYHDECKETLKAPTECKCKEESEIDKALAKEFVKKSIETAEKAANKASNSLKEMIDTLTGESDKEKPKPQHVYKAYIRIGNKSHFDGDYFTIDSLRNRVHELAEAIHGRKPYYYRTWMADGRMQIDFGSYSQFIEVEGITPSEFAKF